MPVKTKAEAHPKKKPATRKRPTLSQQVKDKSEKIRELESLLQRREQELAIANEKDNIVESMAGKLKKSEQLRKNSEKHITLQAEKITELVIKEQEMEKHMSASSEQAELIDELTAKLLDVDIKLSAASMQNKHITAKNLVKSHMVAGMSLGLIPAPLFDVAALTGVQVNMLRTLSKHYEVDFDEQKGKALLTSLLSGSVPVLTVMSLSSFAKLIPGIGSVAGGLSMTVLSGAVIYATGQVFVKHFDLGGTLEDFDGKYWHAYFKQELEEGKHFVKSQLKKNKDD